MINKIEISRELALFESIIGKKPDAFLHEPVYQVTESEILEFVRQLANHSEEPLGVVERKDLLSQFAELVSAPNYWQDWDRWEEDAGPMYQTEDMNPWKWFRHNGKWRPINKYHVCDVVLKDGTVLFDQSPYDFDWSVEGNVLAARHGPPREMVLDSDSSPPAPVAVEYKLHMGDALQVFNALKTEQIGRTVQNAELGAMGATEVTVWNSKVGLTLEMHTAMGGCTLVVRGSVPKAVTLPTRSDFEKLYPLTDDAEFVTADDIRNPTHEDTYIWISDSSERWEEHYLGRLYRVWIDCINKVKERINES